MNITALVRAIDARQTDDRSIDAFAARLAPTQWQRLAALLQRLELAAGELLLRQGEVDPRAFFIESGRLQVFMTGGPPRSHRIATLGEGALVGEPALFGPAPRQASVEALSPVVAWALPAAGLQALAADEPALAYEVLRAAGALMAARLRANLERGLPVT